MGICLADFNVISDRFRLRISSKLRRITSHARQHLWQRQRVTADHELPFSRTSSVVHGRDPTPRSLILCVIGVKVSTIYFKEYSSAASDPNMLTRYGVHIVRTPTSAAVSSFPEVAYQGADSRADGTAQRTRTFSSDSSPPDGTTRGS